LKSFSFPFQTLGDAFLPIANFLVYLIYYPSRAYVLSPDKSVSNPVPGSIERPLLSKQVFNQESLNNILQRQQLPLASHCQFPDRNQKSFRLSNLSKIPKYLTILIFYQLQYQNISFGDCLCQSSMDHVVECYCGNHAKSKFKCGLEIGLLPINKTLNIRVFSLQQIDIMLYGELTLNTPRTHYTPSVIFLKFHSFLKKLNANLS
jgi:hypothetical protein